MDKHHTPDKACLGIRWQSAIASMIFNNNGKGELAVLDDFLSANSPGNRMYFRDAGNSKLWAPFGPQPPPRASSYCNKVSIKTPKNL